MTRKQDHRTEQGFAIFGMVLVGFVQLVSIWRTNWDQIIINLIFLLVMIDLFLLKNKLFNMKEVAIGMFNIINPRNEIGDSDHAEFAVVEENGLRKIDITVTRELDKKNVCASCEKKEEKDNGQV